MPRPELPNMWIAKNTRNITKIWENASKDKNARDRNKPKTQEGVSKSTCLTVTALLISDKLEIQTFIDQ